MSSTPTKTLKLPDDTYAPAVPDTQWIRTVVPALIPPFVTYVWDKCINWGEGQIKYDWRTNEMITYIRPSASDHVVCDLLGDIEEIWVVVKGKEMEFDAN